MRDGSGSIPSTVQPAVVPGSRKRGSGDQGDQDEDRSRTRAAASSAMVLVSRARALVAPTIPSVDPVTEQMDDDPIPISLERDRAGKRRASNEVVGEYQTEEEKMSQRIGSGPLGYLEVEDVLMSRLEKGRKEDDARGHKGLLYADVDL